MPIPTHFHNADGELVEYDNSPLSWRVSAYGIVIKDKKILLIKNKTEKLYDIPGGGVDFGETIDQALAREGGEEAGAHLIQKKLIHLSEDYFFHNEHQAFFQTIQFFYEADIQGDLQEPTEKNISWRDFVPLSELKNYPLPAGADKAVKKLLSEKKLN